jgi:hypothetical protein
MARGKELLSTSLEERLAETRKEVNIIALLHRQLGYAG